MTKRDRGKTILIERVTDEAHANILAIKKHLMDKRKRANVSYSEAIIYIIKHADIEALIAKP